MLTQASTEQAAPQIQKHQIAQLSRLTMPLIVLIFQMKQFNFGKVLCTPSIVAGWCWFQLRRCRESPPPPLPPIKKVHSKPAPSAAFSPVLIVSHRTYFLFSSFLYYLYCYLLFHSLTSVPICHLSSHCEAFQVIVRSALLAFAGAVERGDIERGGALERKKTHWLQPRENLRTLTLSHVFWEGLSLVAQLLR